MSFLQHLVRDQSLPTGMEHSMFALLDTRPGSKDFMTVRLDDPATHASEQATTLDWTGTTCDMDVNKACIMLMSALIEELKDGVEDSTDKVEPSVLLGYYPLPKSTISYLTLVLDQGHESRLYHPQHLFLRPSCFSLFMSYCP